MSDMAGQSGTFSRDGAAAGGNRSAAPYEESLPRDRDFLNRSMF